MTLQEREHDFKIKVNRLISFPHELRQEFIAYWTEKNKSQTKMRFELEKTWDLNRRIARWASTQKIGINSHSKNGLPKSPEIAFKSDIPEVQELDNLLAIYSKHPTSVRFVEFGKYFDFLKEQKIIKKLTPIEIERIKASYPGDNFKCRCACVELTVQAFALSGLTFSDIFKLREKL